MKCFGLYCVQEFNSVKARMLISRQLIQELVRTSAVVVLLLLPSLAAADPILKREFESTYYTHYKEGKCGENTRELAKRALAKGARISSARVYHITNGGYILSTVFRRDSGQRLPSPLITPVGEIRSEPGIKNFYFHVVLEHEGDVYDFDFGNVPEVVSAKDYIRRMFWEEPAITAYTGLEALKWREKYVVEFIPLESFLEGKALPFEEKTTLKEFFDHL